MLQVKRREAIIKCLEKNDAVAVDKLAEDLNVSTMTIRRDLQFLEEQGIAKRTHGGAILATSMTIEVPYKDKEVSYIDRKRRIAKEAAKMVKEGQVIGLDAGTTTMEIARQLIDFNDLTIVTPDVIIAGFLAENTYMKILCTGGYIQNKTGTCMGSITEDFLKGVNIDLSFVGTSALDSESLTTPTFEKAELKREIIKSSREVALVTDGSKFGKRNFVKICDLEQLDYIIIDDSIDDEDLNLLKGNNIEVRLV